MGFDGREQLDYDGSCAEHESLPQRSKQPPKTKKPKLRAAELALSTFNTKSLVPRIQLHTQMSKDI
jgi:hypothetical protein